MSTAAEYRYVEAEWPALQRVQPKNLCPVKQWCERELQSTGTSVDIPTFADFLETVKSPTEVRHYVDIYLGVGKVAEDFVNKYVLKRKMGVQERSTGNATSSKPTPKQTSAPTRDRSAQTHPAARSDGDSWSDKDAQTDPDEPMSSCEVLSTSNKNEEGEWKDVRKKTRKDQLRGGGTEKQSGKKKTTSLNGARVYLKRVCKNERDLRENGPYGEVCHLMHMKNNQQNRKRLQTFWVRELNKGENIMKKRGRKGDGDSVDSGRKREGASVDSGRKGEGDNVDSGRKREGASVYSGRKGEGAHVDSVRKREGASVDSGRKEEGARVDSGRKGEGARVDSGRKGEGARVDSGRKGEGASVDSGRKGEGARVDSGRKGEGASVDSGRKGEGARVDSGRKGEGARVDSGRKGEGARVDSGRKGEGASVDSGRKGEGARVDSGRKREDVGQDSGREGGDDHGRRKEVNNVDVMKFGRKRKACYTGRSMHETYCICSVTDSNWKSKGDMVECEACGHWYHYSCITSKKIKLNNSGIENEVKFICAMEYCKFKQAILMVSGNYLPLKNELTLMKTSNSMQLDDRETTDEMQITMDNTTRYGKGFSDVDDDITDNSVNIITENQQTGSADSSPDKCSLSINIIDGKGFSDDDDITDNSVNIITDNQQTGSAESSLDKCFLPINIISSILQCETPVSNFFTFDLPLSAKYCLEIGQWQSIYTNRKGRYLQRNTWQKVFIDGLSRSNPYCVFKIKQHSVTNAVKRLRKINPSRVFQATGHCLFKDCNVTFKLEMFNSSTVNVTYNGNVKHDIHEQHSRHITGSERQALKDCFKNGQKPLNQFLEGVTECPSDTLLAGNMNGLGLNSHVYAQIACESRQTGREDNDVLQSLLINMKTEQNTNSSFIQKVCANPNYILYWSNAGLDLYHHRAKEDSLFWDATGSVVRKSKEGKQFLYYELALRHPVKGRMGIPVAAMISENQSQPIVGDWIHSFRYAEKRRFGYSNQTQPRYIISDHSMVFIQTALFEYNGENMESFLRRSWKIVNGLASLQDVKKTIVHLCASHFMNRTKQHVMKIKKKNRSVYLYMIGLLMNCSTLPAAEQILLDIFIALLSENIHSENRQNIYRLQDKINKFETLADDNFQLLDKTTEESEQESSKLNLNRLTEEEYLDKGQVSPFRSWGQSIADEATKKAQTTVCNVSNFNPWFSQEFAKHIKDRLIPIYPLWSQVLAGDLSRFKTEYQFTENKLDSSINCFNNPVKTNSTIENRFRILKFIGLQGRTQHRLDEFSKCLKQQTVAIQRLVALESLKTHKALKIEEMKKQTTLAADAWDKSKEQPVNLKDNCGTYQRAPTTEISIGKKEMNKSNANTKLSSSITKQKFQQKFCRLENFGSSCWFNSLIQAFAVASMSKRVISKASLDLQTTVIEKNETKIDLAIDAIIDLWKFIHANSKNGKTVPRQVLLSCLKKVCLATPAFTINNQQDAHEFNAFIIIHIANNIREHIEKSITKHCLNCFEHSVEEKVDGQSIVLNLLADINNISVQTLLDNHFQNEEIDKICEHCHSESQHIAQTVLTSVPQTLIILLARFQFDRSDNTVKKLHTNVHVSPVITLDLLGKECSYSLVSAVCHLGDTFSSGHYVTIVNDADGYICVDDSKKTINVDSDYMLQTGYVLIYEKKTYASTKLCDAIFELLEHIC